MCTGRRTWTSILLTSKAGSAGDGAGGSGIFRDRQSAGGDVPEKPVIPSLERASGSSSMSTKDLVPEGTSEISKGGLLFSPLQVNFSGITLPSAKAGLMSFILVTGKIVNNLPERIRPKASTTVRIKKTTKVFFFILTSYTKV